MYQNNKLTLEELEQNDIYSTYCLTEVEDSAGKKLKRKKLKLTENVPGKKFRYGVLSRNFFNGKAYLHQSHIGIVGDCQEECFSKKPLQNRCVRLRTRVVFNITTTERN